METAQSTAMAQQAEFAQIAASKLDAALNEREIEDFLLSLQKLLRARGGFAAVARQTGLNRTGLYHTLSASGNPTLSTLIALLPLVGLRLSVELLGDSESRVERCGGIKLVEAAVTSGAVGSPGS